MIIVTLQIEETMPNGETLFDMTQFNQANYNPTLLQNTYNNLATNFAAYVKEYIPSK